MGDLLARDLCTSALDRVRHLHIGSWFLHVGAVADLPDLLAEARRRGVAGATGWSRDGSLHDAARHLLRQLAPDGAVVLKCGAEGAYVHTGTSVLHVKAPAVDVIDTVGAGDSLAAGFLHARLRGAGLDEALRLAVAAGTLSTRRSGGVDAQPTPDEAEQLVRQLVCTTETRTRQPSSDRPVEGTP